MKRKATLAGILLAMALALVLLPQAAQAETITLDGSKTTWEAGNTYEVTGDVEISDTRVSTSGSGDVILQLKEGYTLTIPKGIYVGKQTHLIITGPGTLVITEPDDEAAGIGANPYDAGGEITIENATVNVQGGDSAAGIGSGSGGICNNITISGGNVTAKGGGSGAGIGGAYFFGSGAITISDSKVTVEGGVCAAGIGGGYQGKSGAITINDSTVTATGGDLSAGIGGGCIGGSGAITISGGTVTATSGWLAAGIGGGDSGGCGAITITDGTVTAIGDVSGIGNGEKSKAESFQTGDDGKAAIFAKGGDDGQVGINTEQNNKGSWKGIIFDGEDGNVYGNTATPSDSFTIPEGSILTVAKGKTLQINNPVTMTINGNLIVNGKLAGNGTIKPDKFQPSFAAKRIEPIMYNGQAVTIDRILNTDERSDFNGDAYPVYQWHDKDDQLLSDPPVEAGTYYVSATVGETSICKAAELPKTEFTIESKSIAGCTVTLNSTEVIYNGKEQKPKVTVRDGDKTLTEGTDYTVNYEGNFTNAGKPTVKIIGKGNYGTGKEEDNKSADFTIKPKALTADDMTVSLDPAKVTYNGKEQKPKVTVKDGNKTLTEDTDYTVNYEGNFTNAGKPTVKIIGKGNYGTGKEEDNKSADFTIKPKALTADDMTVSLDPAKVTYNGKEQKPKVTVRDGDKTLTEGTDYTVTYSDNINVGTATVTVTGKGNYEGSATKEFTISKKPQKDCDTSCDSGYHSSSDKKSDNDKKDDAKETGDNGDEIIAPETIFSDIQKDDWFYHDVCTVFQKGLMTGTGETTFEPQSPTTRAMLVAILHRMEGSPKATNAATFSDVAAGDWYAQAIAWAEAEGIADGYDVTHFGPNDAMTREQLAAFLMKYSAYKQRDVTARGDLSTFADAANVSDWAEDALRWAVATHLIGGKPDNLIAPQDLATRAELAAILTRYLS